MENLPSKNKQTENPSDVLIIGSGIGGLTAALYAGRENLNTIVLSGKEPGGNVSKTSLIENYPGFSEGINGSELIENLLNQNAKNNISIIFEEVEEVDLLSQPKWVKTNNNEYYAQNVIIATGSTPKKLGIKGEEKFWGKGISTCATCDGPLYKEKTVAVIGGGDKALHEALHLAKLGAKVKIIHRRNEFNGKKALQEEVLNNPNIEIIFDSIVEEIKGDKSANLLNLKKNKNNETQEIKIDGVFLAIGEKPNSEIFNEQIEIDENGYIETNENMQTSIPGVYAVGDVRNSKYKQAITAAADGAIAAMNI